MTLDDEDIERIAARVAELLQEEGPTGARFVDAAVVARKIGVDRDWVYAHARELGGVRLGGPRGRLRFDLPAIRRRLDCQGQPKPVETRRARPRKRPPRHLGNVDLLPYTELPSTGQIGGRAARQRPRPDNGR
ncbi:MAG: hypothetical protein WAU77_03420 [Solirubrobacteraceae bacterium]|jgi:hypothetical protein